MPSLERPKTVPESVITLESDHRCEVVSGTHRGILQRGVHQSAPTIWRATGHR